MSNLNQTESGSFHTYLSEGCKLCQQGAKMVLFITGVCPRDCFYCPVSVERKKDATYANERSVSCDQDVLEEARLMDALGTGITGGEPLLVPERVLHYMRLLKSEFGKGHHIHLYTSLAPDEDTMSRLAEAGLDEIRFHPPVAMWSVLDTSPYARSIRFARKCNIMAGIEIPAIEGIDKVALFAREMDCFLNMNELEFSDSNARDMKLKGFVLEGDISNAVAGSMELTRRIFSEDNTGKVHFCSSTYKDAVQLRERLLRVARNTARAFDDTTEDGTVVYGQIICKDAMAAQKVTELLIEQEIPPEMVETNEVSVETAWWILEDVAEMVREITNNMSIVERYPFENGLVVERIPL
ncbi:MAG: radical SAM protein [Methanolobus sp.]|uniref:radical SAM protein n=1 Tax=Methanolobus sp. TaxID=1874737 RepID=UPI00272F85B4|nr:radical SAM protein [Methanolobus sp.]MDP2216920.1 radical SAM protein [Methanolobus sp.]